MFYGKTIFIIITLWEFNIANWKDPPFFMGFYPLFQWPFSSSLFVCLPGRVSSERLGGQDQHISAASWNPWAQTQTSPAVQRPGCAPCVPLCYSLHYSFNQRAKIYQGLTKE